MFNPKDLQNLTEMFGEVQKKAQEMQEESLRKEFTSKSGGGMVTVRANGSSEILDIEIDDSLLEDKESLQILLISAVNDVLKMVEDDKKASAMNMFGGFGGMNPFGAK